MIGTDLSQIQPLSWMPNCRFVQENSETQDWNYAHQFDFVHLRGMIPCFRDVTVVMRKAYDNLASGGWIELMDGCFDIRAADGSLAGTALERWSRLLVRGGEALGRDLNKARLYREQLRGIGFVDVEERVLDVPGNAWPEAPRDKMIGEYTARSFYTGAVDSFKNLLVTANVMSSDEAEQISKDVKDDIRNTAIRWSMPL